MSNAPRADALLASLVDAALAGAREVMAIYGTDFTVERKADDSPVSEADRNAEQAILTALRVAFRDLPVVAEEACSAGDTPACGRRFLLVDPLDGTKEFISRNGEFTVNIALVEDGVPIAGVVLAPALSLAYAGANGNARKGHLGEAFDTVHDWREIRARTSGPAPVAVASRSHMTPETDAALRQVGACDTRSVGSSLKFCLLAEAAADFYPRLGPTMEWDTAAGDAVLRAAGGVVVALDGRPLRYGKTGVPGIRDFRNPSFIAAGDPRLLAALDFAALEPTQAA